MEDWERERIERAKKGKIEEVFGYFVHEHNLSELKYGCSYESLPEAILREQIHFYLEREGFKWIEESNCFVGVTDKIYQDAKDIVRSALRKYSDLVREVGTIGLISLVENGKVIKGPDGKIVRLVA